MKLEHPSYNHKFVKDLTLMEKPFLKNAIPELARELETLLQNESQPELAGQVSGLRVIDRCRCGDDFCATFYSVPKPSGAWGSLGQHQNLSLAPERGMIILDIVDGRIVCVEVLDRDDVRKNLLEALP